MRVVPLDVGIRSISLRCAGTLCAITLLLGVSCNQAVSLTAVQAMAAQTAASKDAFDAISADFYDSCLRRMQYLNEYDISVCAKEQNASKAWQAANSILLAYIADLGALATDKQTDYGLANLSKAVATMPGVSFSSAQQSAIANAGNTLFSSIFQARRRGALADVMTKAETPDPAHGCPDGCLKDLVNQLKLVAQQDYGGTILTAEDGSIELFYTHNIALAEATPEPLPTPKPGNVHGVGSTSIVQANATAAVGRLVAMGYLVDEESARQAITTKRAAVAQYVAALDQIATTHHSVVSEITNNTPQNIIGIVNGFIATYSAQLSAIEKAFPAPAPAHKKG